MELANNTAAQKERRIVLYKSVIERAIDSLTYKVAQSVAGDGVAGDTLASDCEDGVDAAVIRPLMDKWAATLKHRLSFCIKQDEEVYVADNNGDMSDRYQFDFVLPGEFNTGLLRVVANYMTEYITNAVAMEWFARLNTSYGVSLSSTVSEFEHKIVDIFRGGFVKRGVAPVNVSRKIIR